MSHYTRSPEDGQRNARPGFRRKPLNPRPKKASIEPVPRTPKGGFMKELQEGQPAPDFELKDQDGKTVHLSDYKGKTVILYFYPKDDTPGCTKESCSFRDNLSALGKLGVAVLGVSLDDA